MRRLIAALYPIRGWFPFTFGGLLLLSGALYALIILGGKHQDFLFIVAGGVGVLLSLIGVLSTLTAAFFVWWSLQKFETQSPLMLVENIEQRIPFELPWPWWLPLAQLRWRWINPEVQHRTDRTCEFVRFSRRGEWTQVCREIIVEDPFGFTQVRFRHVLDGQIQVSPDVGKLNTSVLIQGFQSGGDFSHPEGEAVGDRIDLRNYVPGDPVRYILWKVYARTGQLVVRQPERAFQPANRLSLFLISHPADVAAAGAAWFTIQNNLLGAEWRFGVDGSDDFTCEREVALDEIIRSTTHQGVSGDGLLPFAQNVLREGAQRVLVFAPPVFGPWVEKVVSAKSLVNVQVVIGIDGLTQSTVFSSWMQYVLEEGPKTSKATVERRALDALLQKLHQAGIETQLADRQSGQVMSSLLYQRMVS